jgi:vanillate O-demethylase ferredoxin subunit
MSTLLAVRLARKTIEAEDICGLELVPLEGAALPAFAAGAHVELHLPGGLVRPYSLCNDPTETHRYQLGVLRDPASRGGSAAVHEQLQEGQTLNISTPRNCFALVPGVRRNLLLAGGIGITPILAMAEQLARDGADFELHYGARSQARMAFRERIAASGFAARVHCHFDDGAEAQKLNLPALLKAPPADLHLYVCGPKGFMDAVLNTARSSGWKEAQLHWEYFGAEVAVAEGDTAFEVQLASTGQVVVVARDQTIVQALTSAGVVMQTACEQGVCGTCLTRVLDGVPDHRDVYLTPEELAANDQMLPCCSRARSGRLVLDL